MLPPPCSSPTSSEVQPSSAPPAPVVAVEAGRIVAQAPELRRRYPVVEVPRGGLPAASPDRRSTTVARKDALSVGQPSLRKRARTSSGNAAACGAHSGVGAGLAGPGDGDAGPARDEPTVVRRRAEAVSVARDERDLRPTVLVPHAASPCRSRRSRCRRSPRSPGCRSCACSRAASTAHPVRSTDAERVRSSPRAHRDLRRWFRRVASRRPCRTARRSGRRLRRRCSERIVR